MKIRDIIKNFSEEKRKEVEKTVDACMASINCENVNWRDFTVYDTSAEILQKILQNLAIWYLLPIAEDAREESEREIVIFCNILNQKEDEVWVTRVKSKQLHATINLSAQTEAFLSKEK